MNLTTRILLTIYVFIVGGIKWNFPDQHITDILLILVFIVPIWSMGREKKTTD